MTDRLLAENQFNTLLQTNPSANIYLVVKLFTNIIFEAAENKIGKCQLTYVRKNVLWWNDECKTAIQNYKKVLNTFRKTRFHSDHIELKRLRAISRLTISCSKKNSWNKFTSSINHKTLSNIMGSKIMSINGISRTQPKTLYYQNNKLTDKKEITDLFRSFFSIEQ